MADVIGSIGVGLLLLAFVLQLVGVLRTSSVTYQIMNAVGAGAACWASYLLDFIPFVLLEAVWTLASLIALGRQLWLGVAAGHTDLR